jgi:hypothetical protein
MIGTALPGGTPAGVTAHLIARAYTCNSLGPVRVNLRYTADDPHAVILDIATPQRSGWVRWQMARDLLADGLNAPTGEGDVHVSPVEVAPGERGDTVAVELSSPEGVVLLVFDRAPLEKVLDEIECLVPAGTESDRIDWDAEFAALGGGAR